MTRSRAIVLVGSAALVLAGSAVYAHVGQGRGAPPPVPTLGLEHGTLDFDTPDFTLKLVKDSETIAALEPKGAKSVDPSAPSTSRRPTSCRPDKGTGSTTWATSRCA